MPSIIDNTLEIIGDQEEVEKVFSFLKKDDLLISLEKIVPIPDDIPENQIYDWKLDNWGTKGFYPDPPQKRIGNTICFSTCNHHVLTAIEVLSDKFRDLTFQYSWQLADACLDNKGYVLLVDGKMQECSMINKDRDDPVDVDYKQIYRYLSWQLGEQRARELLTAYLI
jgi:hypothetical protein